jgi:hypothetical protein
MPTIHEPTIRALAIAEGLVRTGRATASEQEESYIRLPGAKGGYYWVTYSGDRLLRGSELLYAEDLQPGFLAAMERAGAAP